MADNAEIANDELFKKIQTIIAEKLEVDVAKVTPDATFRGDLSADSLDTYELVYQIETDMGVKIPDEVANEFESVKDAYNYIKSQQQ
ncbi:MAG: acyl carrier protein [Treponema sp.]|nr:acyl carrier protein [Treponema sp.]